ncbi:hypothetical protein ACIPJN_29950 [Streptomyces sp. NPDC086796]|uniref:hypothetical protein n=1 Tax=Streptomyces sp. NPDC086796 TaxID=3365760 RepID=UPI00381BB1C6
MTTATQAPLNTSCEMLAALMTDHGWSVSRQLDGNVLRIEGSRRGGAAVMVTGKRDLEGGPWNLSFYVIGTVEDGWTGWARVRRVGLTAFIETGELPQDARRWPVHGSKCRCAKVNEATQWRARRLLAGVQLKRISNHGAASEKRVYRCPNDARRWHMTSQEKRGAEVWRECDMIL